MVMPKLYEITKPVLQFLSKDTHSIPEIRSHVTELFRLTDEEKTKMKPSGGQTLFHNRVDWARFELKKAGLVLVSSDGMSTITQDGLDVLNKNPGLIDRKFLRTIPLYEKYLESLKGKVTEETQPTITEDMSPEDMIISGFNEYKQNLESEILERIKNSSPDFFEKLVVNLIEKMGYGRGTVTGKSGDGGIDGMIDEDRLGLSQIYLQAKRWQGTVPGKELRDFAGVLDSKKSKKGIFITTSDFSKDAREFVKMITSTIVLINGKKLAELMFEFNVGFSPGDHYQLKTIDEDYFSF
jgi:restriction system protein